ncbi:MAG: hypothetical protein DHS20C11_21030 [Lysobacteraceae bacterium]|nr:MAG: hypothetical protein DHS20C11_21030 [Xanthomonadaceae bacterium]
MSPTEPRQAASVVLLREQANVLQCLLVERGLRRGAFRGFWVFPGGVVDPEDRGADPIAGLDNLLACKDATAYVRAASRELEEETGVCLPEAERMLYFAYWTTPASIAKRFATRFFVASCPDGQGECLRLDEEELVDGRWMSPSEALGSSIKLMPPTRDILSRLAPCKTVADAEALALSRQRAGIPHVLPIVEVVNGREKIDVPEYR